MQYPQTVAVFIKSFPAVKFFVRLFPYSRGIADNVDLIISSGFVTVS